MTQDDRRKFERHNLDCDLPVLNESNNHIFIGVVKNISLNGLLIIGEVELEEDQEIKVRVLGDKHYGGLIETDFEVLIKCAWTEKHGDRYHNGCEFISLPRETLNSVRQIIDTLDSDTTNRVSTTQTTLIRRKFKNK